MARARQKERECHVGAARLVIAGCLALASFVLWPIASEFRRCEADAPLPRIPVHFAHAVEPARITGAAWMVGAAAANSASRLPLRGG